MAKLTFLLDLDNTLSGNDIDKFIPPYFAGLRKYLQQFVDGQQDPGQIIMASVRAMQTNQDPNVTNWQAFYDDFTLRVGRPFEVLQPAIDVFYREEYPKLRAYTTPWPEGPAVVRRLLADGHQVVIATNPLFPATAIEQRMAWAGINDFPLALVTTLENSHFSKPNLRYYQEILTSVNAIPEETWMVGDDPVNDIAPARALGLKSWWMTHGAPRTEIQPECDKQGSLSDFLVWVESGEQM